VTPAAAAAAAAAARLKWRSSDPLTLLELLHAIRATLHAEHSALDSGLAVRRNRDSIYITRWSSQ
jgi:acyl-CoA reductase-like NAD-dependent aldehyde dehydrogenase